MTSNMLHPFSRCKLNFFLQILAHRKVYRRQISKFPKIRHPSPFVILPSWIRLGDVICNLEFYVNQLLVTSIHDTSTKCTIALIQLLYKLILIFYFLLLQSTTNAIHFSSKRYFRRRL